MLAPGDTVDRYVVLAPVGAGGQATVYKARDVASGAVVALKLVALIGRASADARARREAHVLARLVHPSLVRCHRSFEDDRRRVVGMVLEWVQGTTLDRAREDPRWVSAHTHAALVHVASALAKLHEHGVVHRDLKGSNVLVSDAFLARPTDPSSIKLADLGIATGLGNPDALTSVGFVVGTP
ncbi:MAG TPA: protein kinase, partial [Polyangiaceae bacterium]|nr:protein kinase [Polyangiaceae bacterium]